MTKSTKNIILWEKWIDPFDELHNFPLDQDDDDENEDDYDIIPRSDNEAKSAIPVAMTAMGLIPINENARPGKLFNLWIAHTNFNITPDIQNIVENVPGVEIFNIYTPYRMQIGVGKAFTCQDVRKNIGTAVYKYLSPDPSGKLVYEQYNQIPTG